MYSRWVPLLALTKASKKVRSWKSSPALSWASHLANPSPPQYPPNSRSIKTAFATIQALATPKGGNTNGQATTHQQSKNDRAHNPVTHGTPVVLVVPFPHLSSSHNETSLNNLINNQILAMSLMSTALHKRGWARPAKSPKHTHTHTHTHQMNTVATLQSNSQSTPLNGGSPICPSAIAMYSSQNIQRLLNNVKTNACHQQNTKVTKSREAASA